MTSILFRQVHHQLSQDHAARNRTPTRCDTITTMLYADDFNRIVPRVHQITKNMQRILVMLKPAQIEPVGSALSLMLEYFTRLAHQSKLETITVVDASLTAWLARNILEL